MEEEIKTLNQEINAQHQSHYAISPTGLINVNDSPNGNRIYHLYDDGEITSQKGGWTYQQRSEFTVEYPFIYGKSPYIFPNKCGDHMYVILTESECKQMREKMQKLHVHCLKM